MATKAEKGLKGMREKYLGFYIDRCQSVVALLHINEDTGVCEHLNELLDSNEKEVRSMLRDQDVIISDLEQQMSELIRNLADFTDDYDCISRKLHVVLQEKEDAFNIRRQIMELAEQVEREIWITYRRTLLSPTKGGSLSFRFINQSRR